MNESGICLSARNPLLAHFWPCDLYTFLDFSEPSFLSEFYRLTTLPLSHVAMRSNESIVSGTWDTT